MKGGRCRNSDGCSCRSAVRPQELPHPGWFQGRDLHQDLPWIQIVFGWNSGILKPAVGT
jgi:hypothetical protein